jgi:hypothetical protein
MPAGDALHQAQRVMCPIRSGGDAFLIRRIGKAAL